MRKRSILLVVVALALSLVLSSCYSYTTIVGKGPQSSNENTQWNHYLLWGLAPVGVSDSKQLAEGAEDYSVHTRQSFVNGLVYFLTAGIYAPSTTTVTK